MEKLHLAFLWHMHQPFYYDWPKGWLALPWVRLHAVKAYYDLPALLSRFPGAKSNFNLVPSLLKQLRFYEEGGTDFFLELSSKPARELAPEDKEFILGYFFSCHWDTMVHPYPRFSELLRKRGTEGKIDLEKVRERFSTQDFLDLQVWFNLTWVGFAHEDEPLIKELKSKGRDFTEEEKGALLELHRKIIKEIIPLYRKLAEAGQIEISASPFYHPILPLLIDTDLARRNLPQAPLPPRFHHPEDALYQLKEGRAFHQKTLGLNPQGLWPSEGSVCPELIPLATEAGFGWLATDEEILYRSLGRAGPEVLLKPYWATHEGAQIAAVFRHHELSDRIGFVYRQLPAQEAVANLLETAKNLGRASGLKNPFLVLILDGENPWEYYLDGGKDFLRILFERIAEDPEINPVTIGEFLKAYPPSETITELYTGSWINANFDIWIGHEEENRAWEVLNRCRSMVDRLEDLPEEARHALMAAEGSDWFWWYGEHFSSIFDLEFDRLFRGHLQAFFRALGREPLIDLLEPIRRPRPIEPEEIPTAFISPVIDGNETFFFEWIGAGKYSPLSLGEAMYLGESLITALYFGFDLENFYLRLDFKKKILEHLSEKTTIKVTLAGAKHQAVVEFRLKAKDIQRTLKLRKGPYRLYGTQAGRIAFEKILELALPFENLGFVVGEQVNFYLEIFENGIIRERIPRSGNLVFTVPDENFEEVMWQV